MIRNYKRETIFLKLKMIIDNNYKVIVTGRMAGCLNW